MSSAGSFVERMRRSSRRSHRLSPYPFLVLTKHARLRFPANSLHEPATNGLRTEVCPGQTGTVVRDETEAAHGRPGFAVRFDVADDVRERMGRALLGVG